MGGFFRFKSTCVLSIQGLLINLMEENQDCIF